MKETILLAPGLRGTELLRSMALQNQNCMNLRVMGACELATVALMRSGVAVDENLISPQEENAYVFKAAKDVNYFGEVSYFDVAEIAGALRRIRSLITAPDEAKALHDGLQKGTFQEKNEALEQIYKAYLEELKKENALDGVMLVKKAAREAKPMDAEFLVLEEYPLKPMEAELLKSLSGGKTVIKHIDQLYAGDQSATEGEIADGTRLVSEGEIADGTQHAKSFQVNEYARCHGVANEVEYVLANVLKGGRLDQNTVMVTDPKQYSQLFFDYAVTYDLPVTFGTGLAITNSYPARLLKHYLHWMTKGLYGAEALKDMLTSPFFAQKTFYEEVPGGKELNQKEFLNVLAGLRLTNDRENNEAIVDAYEAALKEEWKAFTAEQDKERELVEKKQELLPAIRVAAGVLSLPCMSFIDHFAVRRKVGKTVASILLAKLDQDAASEILDQLSVASLAGNIKEKQLVDLIESILNVMVCQEYLKPGYLHVTTLEGAFSALRDRLYVMGLSADLFPGAPVENALLLDDDVKNFGEGLERFQSKGKVEEKRRLLMRALELNAGASNYVALSYSGFASAELKKENASSILFEIFQRECEQKGEDASLEAFEKRVKTVTYFEPALTSARGIGEAYLLKQTVNHREKALEEGKFQGNLKRSYSPSVLGAFFACPKRFMIGSILGIPMPEEDRLFEVMPATDLGTLVHELMEVLRVNKNLSKEDFLKLCEAKVDRYFAGRRPLIQTDAEAKKREFLEIMGNAYGMEPHLGILLTEEDIECEHEESKVLLHGFPDRVEQCQDGTYLVVDFKTGRNLEHVQDDFQTCFQVVIYAYILEKVKGIRVSGCEYRYLRLGKVVTCKYDDAMKEELKNALENFKACMEKGEFKIPEEVADGNEEVCRYCKYGDICGKREVK